MNYFLLAETDFFRLINEAGDCNMETVENPGGGDHVTRVRLTPWPFLGLTIDN